MSHKQLEPAFSFSEVQTALLSLRSGAKKFAVKIGTTTPFYLCSGQDPITYDGDVYSPWGMEIGSINIAGGGRGASLTLDNVSGDLSTANFVETFSGVNIEIHFFLRRRTESWTHVISLAWTVESVSWNLETLSLDLTWGVGTRPRAGLEIASERCALATQWNINNIPKGGPLCQYNGAENRCSGTWDDCKLRSNTARFRGFRLAPPPGYSLRVLSGSFQFQTGYLGVEPPSADSGEDPLSNYRDGGDQRRIPDPPLTPSDKLDATQISNPSSQGKLS